MPSSSYFCSLKSAMTCRERTQRDKTAVNHHLPPWKIPTASRVSQRAKIIGCHQGKSSLVSTPDTSYESFSSLISALCLAYLSDDLSHILYHHLICCYRLHCKQTPLVDVTPAEANPLLAELKCKDMNSHFKSCHSILPRSCHFPSFHSPDLLHPLFHMPFIEARLHSHMSDLSVYVYQTFTLPDTHLRRFFWVWLLALTLSSPWLRLLIALFWANWVWEVFKFNGIPG